MTRHIIVGAGLGGLYTANRLINRGVEPENILLIDPRAGIYTRPGHLNSETFPLVTEFTGISTHKHSTANHIKELERMMYNALIRKKATFVNERFVELQAQDGIDKSKAVITETKDGNLAVYPADFVFDCTGKEGYVAQEVNRHQQLSNNEPFFKSSPLIEVNPITDHLVAQVIISNINYLNHFFTESETEQSVPLRYSSPFEDIVAREQLQSLGWPYEAFPTFYFFPEAGKKKVCLYMETPPNLPKMQQEAWIKLLLTIYSKGRVTDYSELKPSKKYDHKPRIMGFKSTPYHLNKAVFQSDNLPVVLIGFDALKGFDYRLANVFISGIRCCEHKLNGITIRQGKIISVNCDVINNLIFDQIHGLDKSNLSRRLNSRQKAIENGYEYFSEIYETAAVSINKSKTKIIKRYQLIAGELGYQSALIQFNKLQSRDKSALVSIEALNKCLSVLIRARNYLPAHNTSAHHDINSKVQSLINELRFELSAFNMEQILANPNSYSSHIKALFESIKQNFKQLDGTFANALIQKKSSEIIKKIDSKELSRPSANHLERPSLVSFLRFGSAPDRGPTFFQSASPSPTGSINKRDVVNSLVEEMTLSEDDNHRENMTYEQISP